MKTAALDLWCEMLSGVRYSIDLLQDIIWSAFDFNLLYLNSQVTKIAGQKYSTLLGVKCSLVC